MIQEMGDLIHDLENQIKENKQKRDQHEAEIKNIRIAGKNRVNPLVYIY